MDAGSALESTRTTTPASHRCSFAAQVSLDFQDQLTDLLLFLDYRVNQKLRFCVLDALSAVGVATIKIAIVRQESAARRYWNRIPPRVRQRVVDAALADPERSPRELAWQLTGPGGPFSLGIECLSHPQGV